MRLFVFMLIAVVAPVALFIWVLKWRNRAYHDNTRSRMRFRSSGRGER